MPTTSTAPLHRDEAPRYATSWLGLLACIVASAGPLAVVAIVLTSTITHQQHCGALALAPLASASVGEVAPAASGPTEYTAVLTVGAAANVAVEYSTSWEHSVARCINTTTGVALYIVNAGAADTTAGSGPYCDTCVAGPILPPIGRGYLRTSAGSANVRCSFNDGWGTQGFPPGGPSGGLTMGAADTRYVNISGDTMTGQLTTTAGTACTAPALRIGDADTGFALTNVGTAPGHAVEVCVDGTRAGLISIGATPATCSYGNLTMGWQAGAALDLSGDCSNDDAIHNTLLGAESGVNLSDGMQATCVGNRTCHDMVVASQSTCVGQGACYERTGGTDVAVGFHTLVNVDTALANSAFGYRVLEGTNGSGATATGDRNAVFGYMSLSNYSTASQMSVLGYNAARDVTTAQRGVIIGHSAADSMTSSIDSVVIGREAAQAITSENGVTIVGAGAAYLLTDTETTCVGWACLPIATTSTKTTVVGSLSGNTLVTGDQVTLVGADTDVTAATRANCSAFGYGATCAADNSVKLGNASITAVSTTGAWRGPDGTAAAPAISASSDTDSGWYYLGLNRVNLALNALRAIAAAPASFGFYAADGLTALFAIEATYVATAVDVLPATTDAINLGNIAQQFLQAFFDDGTVARPAIVLNDANTGFYSAAANHVDVACNGVACAKFYEASVGEGYIALGTSAGSSAMPSIHRVGDTNSGIGWYGADNMGISVGGVQQAGFTTAGPSLGGPMLDIALDADVTLPATDCDIDAEVGHVYRYSKAAGATVTHCICTKVASVYAFAALGAGDCT